MQAEGRGDGTPNREWPTSSMSSGPPFAGAEIWNLVDLTVCILSLSTRTDIIHHNTKKYTEYGPIASLS